jgi:hypothetical protein
LWCAHHCRTYREAFQRFGGLEAAARKHTHLFSWNDEPVARSLNHHLTRWAGELLQVDLLHPGLALVLWNLPGDGFLLHTGMCGDGVRVGKSGKRADVEQRATVCGME